MRLRAFVVSPIGSNCYVIAEDAAQGNQAVIVDPGDVSLDPVFDYIAKEHLEVVAVWNTHAHFDHVAGVDVVRNKFQVPAWVHADDLPLWDNLPAVMQQWLGKSVDALRAPDHFWKDGDVVALGQHKFTVWHTPGHSPGSVCLVGEQLVFTGDTLFAGSIGRTDLPLSDSQAMMKSLQRLLDLPDALELFPGHMQSTTMQRERMTNPFLRSALQGD
ncbi:MBL fold metallo-hydrolase [Alicyclobacillus tolerans]|uniref:MBL fold metallo-hydrolase n=1 Tax=Alicyclobacillus tolerans TaxID=90970 RepID=UPI001F446D96|nr:MBL fold metallo-hydrolase [Alicyclobacillus tolerans]MCF8565184.1 MBL fold metallo-hydrolase [Alicyclobacillus tolerans]